MARINLAAVSGSAPAEAESGYVREFSGLAYIQVESWGAAWLVYPAPLHSASVLLSLDFGLNLSTYKKQLPACNTSTEGAAGCGVQLAFGSPIQCPCCCLQIDHHSIDA